jgi:hypothetical protein
VFTSVSEAENQKANTWLFTMIQKYQTKEEVPTKVLLKYETNLNNSVIVRLDLFLRRI